MRRSPLKRRAPLTARRKPAEATPERYAYKEVVWGCCEACGAVGFVRRHHVVYEQVCRREGFPLYSIDNSMLIGVDWTCRCHERHHHPGVNDTRILLSLVPLRAKSWCLEMFGEERGRDYLERTYRSAA